MTTPGCNIIIHITYALKLGPVLGFEGVVLAQVLHIYRLYGYLLCLCSEVLETFENFMP